MNKDCTSINLNAHKEFLYMYIHLNIILVDCTFRTGVSMNYCTVLMHMSCISCQLLHRRRNRGGAGVATALPPIFCYVLRSLQLSKTGI